VRAIRAANPASWITPELLAEQRRRLPGGDFLRFHANARVARKGSWIPPGAWQACVGVPTFEPGERVWIGVDVGGERSHTAVVWISESLQVGCAIFEGEEGVLRAVEQVRELAATYAVAECIYDPWRFGQAALELEREGLRVVQYPQTDVRLVPSSQRLREAIVERRITLPDDRQLALHAANAMQRHGRRGWRLDRPDRSSPIDGLIALCMALDRAEQRPEPARLVGFL
jgi:phage terminase large subunit-like protein